MSERKKGATSVSLLFRLTDSTTGAAKAAIDVTTLKLQYERPGEVAGTATSLTLLAALTTAWTSYGAKEVDATNSKGVYRVDCPDAAFTTGADEVSLSVTGAGIEPATRLIDLTALDSRDAVRAGLTALPNAAAGANNGLPLGDASGRVDLGKILGTASAGAAGYVGLDWGHITAPTTTVALTGTTIATTQKVDVETIKTQAVTCAAGVTVLASVGTAATSTAQTGDSFARIGVAGAGLTALGDTRMANLDAAVSSRSTYAGGAVASVTAPVTVGTNSDKTGYVLTSGERTAIANEVEAQIIDETDSEKVLTAITDKIASVNPSLGGLTLAAIASSVWANSTRLLTAGTNIVLAKGVGVTGFNDLSAAQVNTEADTALADVGLTTTVTARIDAAITSRLASASYTAPDNTGIGVAAGAAASAATSATAIKVKTDQFVFTVAGHVDATATIGGNVTVGGYAAGQDPATLVLDSAASGHNVAGSIGAKINAAGTAGDPWSGIAVNGKTYGEIMIGMGAVMLGNVTENAPHNTTTFRDVNDPDPGTTRVTSTNTATGRTVTLH